jgi:hypothetical protein
MSYAVAKTTNVANTVVRRDASGAFTAGDVTTSQLVVNSLGIRKSNVGDLSFSSLNGFVFYPDASDIDVLRLSATDVTVSSGVNFNADLMYATSLVATGTVTAKNLVLTSAGGGVITFQDGTTQATSATNLLAPYMLKSGGTFTGVVTFGDQSGLDTVIISPSTVATSTNQYDGSNVIQFKTTRWTGSAAVTEDGYYIQQWRTGSTINDLDFVMGGISTMRLTGSNGVLIYGSLDTATAAPMNIGVTNATDINIGRNNQTVNVTSTLAAAGPIHANGGIDRTTAAALLIGVTTANAITLGRSGITTTLAGILAANGGIQRSSAGTLNIATDANTTRLDIGTNAAVATFNLGASTKTITAPGLLNMTATSGDVITTHATSNVKFNGTVSQGGTTHTSFVNNKLVTVSSATYTAGNEYIIHANASAAPIVITLPTASTASGRTYHIKKTDSSANTVTIDPSGTETIDGAATYVILTQYESVMMVSDATNWYVH